MASFAHECKNHPGIEGTQYCSKYNRYLCPDCAKCNDIKQYCKFRTMCIIWELTKHPEEVAENEVPVKE